MSFSFNIPHALVDAAKNDLMLSAFTAAPLAHARNRTAPEHENGLRTFWNCVPPHELFAATRGVISVGHRGMDSPHLSEQITYVGYFSLLKTLGIHT